MMEFSLTKDMDADLNSDWIKHLPGGAQEKAEAEAEIGGLKSLGGPGSGNFGHAGRPGKVGGSAATSRYGIGTPRTDLYLTNDNLYGMQWYKDGDRALFFDETASRYKMDASVAMSYDLDEIKPYQTSRVLKIWANSSNDEDLRSLSLQKAAADTFGVEMSEWQKNKYESLVAERGDFPVPSRLMFAGEDLTGDIVGAKNEDMTRALLQGMYQRTQNLFRANGVERVTVFRGVRIPKGTADGSFAADLYKNAEEYQKYMRSGNRIMGREVSLKDSNALESWSLSADTARSFADSGKKGELGITLVMEVPVSRIMSTAATGIGCLTELEVVLLSEDKDVAKVWDYKYNPDTKQVPYKGLP